MSDFFRIPNGNLGGKTLRQLAVLCHEAEDAADDILLMQVQSEVQHRKMDYATSPFMEFYRDVWKSRHAAN